MKSREAIARAERLLGLGDHNSAERELAALWGGFAQAPGTVLHLLGIIRRRQNKLVEAERYLRRAVAAEPAEPRHHVALGDILRNAGFFQEAAQSYAEALRLAPGLANVQLARARALLQANRAVEAEAAAREAVAHAPSAEAWETLSSALRGQDKLEEALAAASEGLKIDASHAAATHARAVSLSRLGRNEEAIEAFDSLAARGVVAPALWLNRGVALLGLTRDEAAERVFSDGVARWPFDLHLQNALANVRWMRGAGGAFTRDYEAAVSHQPDFAQLRIGCADLLRRADLRERSEALLRAGLRRNGDDPALLASLGVLLDELGRAAEGLPFLERAVSLVPGSAPLRANLTCALLRLGRCADALMEILPARTSEPLNQEWICYETMALRQIGHPRYHELCDYERMVRAFDLQVPPGYADIASFNEALASSLSRLHILQSHPLDQSLRHGSQTTRSLLYVKDPVIEAYIKALDGPIRAYIDSMGPPQAGHPWSGRNSGGYKLAGAWSVKLKARGYHINHLHPAGWISSAYYVSLPKAVAESSDQQGWIKFGEPRWPTPGCTIEKVVQPKAGRLVLFPSYMWHGTIPFEDGERMTAPFDALPA